MSEKQTRSKKKEIPKMEKKKHPSIDYKRHVFFVKDDILESGQDIHLEKMRHPGTEEPAFFIFSKPTRQISEILQFNQSHRSWFIDEYVSSNGRCSLTIPVDPMFFALYYLHKNCSKLAIPFDQISDDDYPKAVELLQDFVTDEMLIKLADRKGPADLQAYKFNKDKVLAWLAIKAELVAKTLLTNNIRVGDNAVSANYVIEEKTETLNEECLEYAVGIVGSYVPLEIYQDLRNYLNLSESVKSKRKSQQLTIGEQPSSKKVKIEGSISIVVSPPVAPKEKKISAKAKALQKAASGTRGIASFFKK